MFGLRITTFDYSCKIMALYFMVVYFRQYTGIKTKFKGKGVSSQ